MKSPIKIAVADDDAFYRAILVEHINTLKDMELVLEAGNGSELIAHLQQGKAPDIVLLDLVMPLMDGKETLEYLSDAYPGLKVLILTHYHDDELFSYLIEKGANSFVPKERGFSLLTEVIYTVKKTGYYFANVDLKKIIAAKKPAKPIQDAYAISFTKREIEVIQLICQGYTNKEISKKLSISQRTVDAHKNNMLQKAKVHNAVSLMVYAIKNNLVNIELLL